MFNLIKKCLQKAAPSSRKYILILMVLGLLAISWLFKRLASAARDKIIAEIDNVNYSTEEYVR